MVQLTNELEVVGFLSTFVFQSVGFKIIGKEVDKQSYVVQIHDLTSNSTIFVTIIHLPNNQYIYTVSNKNDQEYNLSWTFDYDDYFQNLKLPVTDDELDLYFEKYKGNWEKTFPGSIAIKIGKFSTLEEDIIGLRDHSNGSPQRFYSGVLVPTFKKYRGLNEQDDDIQILNEIKRKLFDISTPEKDIDYEFQPSRPINKLTNENTNAISSLDLPKFDDEYEILKNKNGNRPSNLIPSIGDNDLNPLGTKYPSMKPYLDPLSDYNPSNTSGFNGMIPDKSHPLFTGGGAGVLPQGNVGDHPQGSRYDDPFVNDKSAELGLPTGSLGGPGFSRGEFHTNPDFSQGGFKREGSFPGEFGAGGSSQGGFSQGGFSQGGFSQGGFSQGGFF